MKKLKTPEECLILFLKWFTKERKIAFFSAFIVAIISNIFLTDGLEFLKRDGLKFALFYNSNKWEISLGRWGLEYIEMTRLNLAIPIVMLIISSTVIALSAVFLIDLFKLKNKVSIMLSSLALAISPVFMVICLFPYTADSYCYAWLLSILSIYLIYNAKSKILQYILPILCICLALSIYQSYLGVILALAIMMPIIRIMREEEKKDIWKKIGQSILAIAGGCVLYLGLTFLILKIKDVNLASYKGANSVSFLNIITALPSSILKTYKTTFSYFFGNQVIANTNYGRDILYACFFCLAIITMVTIIIQKKIYKEKIKLVMLFFFLLCLPIGLDIIEVVVTSTSIYVLEAYQFTLIIPFVICLMENLEIHKGTILKWGIVGSCILILFTYYLQTNASYTAIELMHNQLYSTAVRIVDRIENNENYQNKMKVCFAGTLNEGIYPSSEDIWDKTYIKIVNLPILQTGYTGSTSNWKRFLSIYLGIDYTFCSKEQYAEIINSQEFKEMPIFPLQGSVKEINNVMVVKLIENPDIS